MNIRIRLILLSAMFVSGCATAPFIVVEQTAPSPSFTIIPYDGDSDFSRKIEREILALNFKIVERPELKYISTDAQKTESKAVGAAVSYGRSMVGGSSGESVTASLYKVDVVAMYPVAKSDYIVVTYTRTSEIRILRKSDLALIASGVYDGITEMPKFVMSLFANAKIVNDKTIIKEFTFFKPIAK